jgi:ribosome recycling factor
MFFGAAMAVAPSLAAWKGTEETSGNPRARRLSCGARRAAMIQDVQKEMVEALGKAHDALKRDLTKLRAGRANAGLLEGIRVDYYGTPTALSQMAHINVPEPRLITVKPWDKTQVKAVEKAIRESDLGLNPQVDGDLVRIPLPPLTEERRKEFVKIARKYGEDCKITIRKARHDAIDMLAALESGGDASADDVDRAKKKVEELVQDAGKQVDSTIAHKEKDILEV